MPKFRELEKRSIYKTWRYKNRSTDTVCLVHCISSKNYHYEIYNKQDGFKLSSLEDNLTYKDFDSCSKDLLKLAEHLKYYKF